MSLALDMGAHACRSLRGGAAGLVARRSRSTATWLEDGELPRQWLERHRIPFFPCDGHLAMIGEPAEELAQLFPVPCQDLLLDGKVPYSDAVTRQLIALVVEALLPQASADGEICCFSQPAHQQTSEQPDPDLDRRLEFTSRLIRLRGFEPSPLNPAAALALAELEPEKFTGIGVSLGASGGDIVFAHRGNPTVVARTGRGGRWIDEELARRTGRICQDLFGERVFDVEGARRRKETMSLISPTGDDEKLVFELYRQLADELALGVSQLIETNPLLVRFSQPLTVVLGGGALRIAGFDEIFRKEMARRMTSSAIGTIRYSTGGEFTVARGCLIHATLVTRSRLAA
jgi:hypothetical protein